MRGSRQYWPHKRARRLLPRVRSNPQKTTLGLNGLIAYKAGMATAIMIDDSESPSKQQEISRACTILEVPRTVLYGIRLYGRDKYSNYKVSCADIYDSSTLQKLGKKTIKSAKLEDVKKDLSKYIDIRALLVSFPKGLPVGTHHIQKFEVGVGGKDINEKFSFLESMLGKPVSVKDIIKQGEYVNVTSISKGKGWQGVIKRYGVARVSHKATQKVRHVGTLGPSTPGKVLFTVPQAGQMGFNYRSERNKRVIKIGDSNESASINISGGLLNYGNVHNEFIVLEGSVPGPAKRLVRIRESQTKRNVNIKEPKVISIR
ncbi:MAG: 50S ribosomal protein L3 [Candidatus Micrarchaeaceae archaeon]